MIQQNGFMISIDSIAKLSPRIQCISVIAPFGFYRIDSMILSIDWVLSMNYSIDYLSLMIEKYLKNTNHELWLDYHHQRNQMVFNMIIKPMNNVDE